MPKPMPRLCSLGGWSGSGFDPDPVGGCPVKLDPYRTKALPTAGSCITAAEIPAASVDTRSNKPSYGVTVKNTTATPIPGTYCGGLHVATSGVANLRAGAYIIKDGTLEAPTSGTYKSFAVIQDRTTGVGDTNTLYSKGGVNIEGAFYTPKQELIVWANDTMNSNSKYFPMIVNT
jgi:hypothetical protein